ncbi:MAG: DNA adenine methylase [Anaerolineae bacterium]|nr:DNA adenine methylase [Anaerolineae bacterium]
MQYLGGKSRIAATISQFLEAVREPGQEYLEPFLGAAWVFVRMAPPKIGSDLCKPLITMWQAVVDGWDPPQHLTEEEYKQLKSIQDPDSPLTAFAGFGCSWGGKWFAGYARGHVSPKMTANSILAKVGRNYTSNAGPRIRGKVDGLSGSVLVNESYNYWQPINCLIYCDPPYQGTTGYSAIGKFDWAVFWSTMRQWSEVGRSNRVYISSYTAPDDFNCVLSINTRTDLRTTKANGVEPRVEKLFTWSGGLG